MDNPGSSEAGSPQASLQDAAKVVLSALSNIRKSPELRRNFVSGNSNAALEAIDEVRNIFQPKGRKPAKKDTPISAEKKRKERRNISSMLLGAFHHLMLLLIHLGKTGMNSTP